MCGVTALAIGFVVQINIFLMGHLFWLLLSHARVANLEVFYFNGQFAYEFYLLYRRGYATEKQKGFLLVEKLDYIQSKVLQGIFSIISKPLRKVGKMINKV